jgi:hypothetical protein
VAAVGEDREIPTQSGWQYVRVEVDLYPERAEVGEGGGRPTQIGCQ